MKLNFYEVSWRDAETESGWKSADETKLPTKLTKSYGFLIKQSAEYYTVGADFDEETKMFNRLIHIPQNMIIKKRRINL